MRTSCVMSSSDAERDECLARDEPAVPALWSRAPHDKSEAEDAKRRLLIFFKASNQSRKA